MGIIKAPFPNQRKKSMQADEDSAKEKLKTFIEELQNEHDVRIIPDIVFGLNELKGLVPIHSQLNVISNKRFKK